MRCAGNVSGRTYRAVGMKAGLFTAGGNQNGTTTLLLFVVFHLVYVCTLQRRTNTMPSGTAIKLFFTDNNMMLLFVLCMCSARGCAERAASVVEPFFAYSNAALVSFGLDSNIVFDRRGAVLCLQVYPVLQCSLSVCVYLLGAFAGKSVCWL